PVGETLGCPGPLPEAKHGPYKIPLAARRARPFPGARQEQFHGARQRDGARAEVLDPAAFNPGGTWQLYEPFFPDIHYLIQRGETATLQVPLAPPTLPGQGHR